MRINEAAAQSGVSASTIRYYEEIGLLGTVGRTAAGYRSFNEHDVALLVFLRKARDLGFTLEDCRALLELVASPNRSDQHNVRRAREIARARLDSIDEQMAELKRNRELVKAHFDSLGKVMADCPVTKEL